MLRERHDAWRKLDTRVLAAQDAFAAVADRPALVLKLLGVTAERSEVALATDDRVARTLLGALIGALFGFGGVMLWAWTDGKVRRADPAPWTAREAPLVGVVPEVNTGQDQPDAPLSDAARAKMQQDLSRLADAVHAIRAVVEAQLGGESARMICVTSAAPHSGKTSLTVGLASSLVMGGMRVLVVDAALTDRVAREANDRIAGGAQSLDEVMTGMEFLDAEDRDRLAFADDEDETVGLGAYLHGTPLEQAEIRTRIPGLGLLSGVGVQAGDSGRLSSGFFKRLGQEASRRYDVVLMDTGSIPRCVESLFVAGACDGVLLVVGRRESRRAVDIALQRLRLVGARILGTVFNRDQAAPDPTTATGTGSTIDPSWRDQGSGMFAAAVRTHSGQPGVYEPEQGQTGLYRGEVKTDHDDEDALKAASGPASNSAAATASAATALGMEPIDFAADDSASPIPPIEGEDDELPPLDPEAVDLNAETAVEGDLIDLEQADPDVDTDPEEPSGGSFIDRYIDAVLDAATEETGDQAAEAPGKPSPSEA